MLPHIIIIHIEQRFPCAVFDKCITYVMSSFKRFLSCPNSFCIRYHMLTCWKYLQFELLPIQNTCKHIFITIDKIGHCGDRHHRSLIFLNERDVKEWVN